MSIAFHLAAEEYCFAQKEGRRRRAIKKMHFFQVSLLFTLNQLRPIWEERSKLNDVQS